MPQSSKISIKVPPHLLPSDISVFGYGVTSKPFVEFINSLGKTCSIYDDKFEVKSSDECGNTLLPPSAFDESKSNLEFISPGILPTHSDFSKARNPIGEYDYAYNLMSANDFELKSIWISGTNGKTTTTQMLTHLLESFGALCGGNIGTPLTTLTLKHAQSLESTKNPPQKEIYKNQNNPKEKTTNTPKKDSKKEPFWVLESSSFAMHYAHIATPQIYLLLPLSQDHISWHSGYEGYIEDKLRVLARMGKGTCALLPQELKSHKIVQEYIHKNHSKPNNECTECAIFYEDSSDLAKFLGIELDSIPFGEPFLLDALVALSGAVLTQKMGLLDFGGDFSASPAYFLERLKSFHIGAHRIEEFYEPYNQNGAKSNLQWLWVDDSKGTNTDATLKAFARYKGKRIYALLGGDDKGADIEPIFALIADGFCKKNSFVKIFAIGSNEKKILSLAQKYDIPAFACQNLKNAMKHIKSEREKDLIEFSDDFASEAKSSQPKSAQQNTEKNAKQDSKADFIASFVGLLSPAAASLDQFRSYKERGELFKKYALES